MSKLMQSEYLREGFGEDGFSAKSKALIALFIAIIIWGGNWPVMKLGLDHITPLWFSMVRFALGGAVLFAFQLVTKSLYTPKKSDIALIASVGLIQMMTFTVLGSLAMTTVDAGRSAILAYTTTLWVLPLSVLLFREPLSKKPLLGTLLGLTGVLVLFNPFSFDWGNKEVVIANGFLLIAALGWSLCILHLRHTKSKATAYQLAPWQMLVATVMLIPIAYRVEGAFTGDGSVSFWQICFYLGPLATAFCFCAVNGASQQLSSTFISTTMLAVPVTGLIFSCLLLGEAVTAPLVIGTLFICGGIFYVTRSNA